MTLQSPQGSPVAPAFHAPETGPQPALGAEGAPCRVRCTVNGTAVDRVVEPRKHLGDFLREDLGLTGTHLGCEHGVCGSCTIVVDSVPARACLMLAVQADGATIRTVEGLAQADGSLHAIQEAFWNRHGLQCGFCTPGMLTAARALLSRNPNPTREEVVEGIAGNICRCTGYEPIIAAILAAAGRRDDRRA